MALILRQSTAMVVSFGIFVDKTDGVTLETALAGTGANQLDNATTGVKLSKNGGALAVYSSTTDCTYDSFGNYFLNLDTTDTNTVGTLRAQYSDAATCLPVWMDFQVIEEAVFDALFAASATGALSGVVLAADQAVNATKIGGTAQTGRDLGASVLLSSGTGTGQISLASGIASADVKKINAKTITGDGSATPFNVL